MKPINEMNLDEVNAALEAIPAARNQCHRKGDLDGLAVLKHREVDLRDRIARIKIGNLKEGVERFQAQVAETERTYDAQYAAATAQLVQANADVARIMAEHREAERRRVVAIGEQDRLIRTLSGHKANLVSAQDELERATYKYAQ